MTTQTRLQKLSIFELIDLLSKGQIIELETKESLIITQINPTDFLNIANQLDFHKKLNVLQDVFAKHDLQLNMEGGLSIGAMNLDEYSWILSASESQSLTISAKFLPAKLDLSNVISFLKKLPLGQGISFHENQDVILSGFSEQALSQYFELSKNNNDPKVLESTQDALFQNSSSVLREENLSLKIYAINASHLDREVNPRFGFVNFKPRSQDNSKNPKIFLTLTRLS